MRLTEKQTCDRISVCSLFARLSLCFIRREFNGAVETGSVNAGRSDNFSALSSQKIALTLGRCGGVLRTLSELDGWPQVPLLASLLR